MNEVNLIGRLGGEPETNNGTCRFSIATNDGTKEKPKTNWHNIVAFGKIGETLQKFLKKGQQVGISGRLDYYKNEDKFYTSIIVKSFTFLSNNLERSEPQHQVRNEYQQENQYQEPKIEMSTDEEDDLPF